MRHSTFSRYRVLLAALTPLLSSCSHFGPPAPEMPQAQALKDFKAQQIDALRTITGDDGKTAITPDEFIQLGYAYVDQQCNNFFIALQRARNENDFSAGELATLSGIVVPALTVAKASASAIAATGAVFGFGGATLLNYGQFALLTQYHAELQDLVHSALNNYKQQVGAEIQNLPNALTYAMANSYVGGYAWQCSLPGIDSLARSALAKSSATAPPPAPPPTALQTSAIAAIGQTLGLRGTDQLTLNQAAALIVFSKNKTADSASKNVQKQLKDTQLKLLFVSPTDTILTVKAVLSRKFDAAILELSFQQIPALDQAVADHAAALTTQTPTPPPPTPPPNSPPAPAPPAPAPPAPAPPAQKQPSNLGAPVPQVQVGPKQ